MSNDEKRLRELEAAYPGVMASVRERRARAVGPLAIGDGLSDVNGVRKPLTGAKKAPPVPAPAPSQDDALTDAIAALAIQFKELADKLNGLVNPTATPAAPAGAGKARARPAATIAPKALATAEDVWAALPAAMKSRFVGFSGPLGRGGGFDQFKVLFRDAVQKAGRQGLYGEKAASYAMQKMGLK